MSNKTKSILVILSLCITMLLCACSSKSSSEDVSNEAKPATEMSKEEASIETDSVTEEAAAADGGIQFDTTNKLNRKVIKTGTINLQTKTFDDTVQSIMDKVDEIGGFIQNCSIEGSHLYRENRRYANLSVRIPNTEFDKFMNESNQFGNVTSKSVQGEDVTDQYMDTEIRLETLEIQAERLKELLKQAGDLDKLFKIEKELAHVTYEIESLKGTLKKYDSLIDYSTIDIYVEDVEVYVEVKEDTFIDRIKNTFMNSVRGLVTIAQGIVLVIIGITPFLIIILPIVAVVIWLVCRRENRKKNKEE